MSRPKFDRLKKQYVEDHPHEEVHKLDCVPSERPYGSWTNGVKAWSRKHKNENGSESLVGWFHPPRRRTSPPNYRKNSTSYLLGIQKPVDEERQRVKRVKHYLRILRSRGYSMKESQDIMAGLIDTELRPIVPEFESTDEISTQEEE
jgi:hypothetical protein